MERGDGKQKPDLKHQSNVVAPSNIIVFFLCFFGREQNKDFTDDFCECIDQ